MSRLNGKTALVTGAAGFIGSHLLKMLVEESSLKEIIVVDKLTYAGSKSRISKPLSQENVHFYQTDICDEAELAKIFSKHDIQIVFHLAAESHVDRSILGPKDFLLTNIMGTMNLLELVKKHWTTGSDYLFLQVSTDEVFGDLGLDDPAFSAESPYQPSSPYSASKASADHLVRAWGRTFDIPYIVTNCSNNFGTWQHPEKLIPLMCLNAIRGKKLPVYGDGKNRRDWINVKDHSRGILTAASQGAIGETYVFGGDNEMENIEIVQMICKTADKVLEKPSGTTEKLITKVADRKGHDRRYAVNNSKVIEKLNWQPSKNLQESIEEIFQWYLKNQDWASEQVIISKKYFEEYYQGIEI